MTRRQTISSGPPHYLDMPDPFSTLSAPLPLMIFEGIEDLSTLNYLLHSSPAANAIFETCYCKISEAVLSSFVPQLQQLLHTVLIIRSNRLSIREGLESPHHLDDFLHTCALNNSTAIKPLINASVSLSAVEAFPSPPAMCNRRLHRSLKHSWTE